MGKRLVRESKLGDYRRLTRYIVFKLKDGTVVASLEHDEPLEDSLSRITVNVGGKSFFRLIYPHNLSRSDDRQTSLPEDMDLTSTPANYVMIAVEEVTQVWTQMRPR